MQRRERLLQRIQIMHQRFQAVPDHGIELGAGVEFLSLDDETRSSMWRQWLDDFSVSQ
jgi:hypothetical protein